MQVLCLVAALLTSEGIAAKDLHETAYMKLGREAAPWIPRIMDILESRRPPRWYADQIAVIKGAEGQQYLVVIWKGRRYKGEWVLRTPHIEFHKYIETP